MYQRIVVPLDGSDVAEQALPEAQRLALLTGAPIHLVRVIDPTQLPWYGSYGVVMDAATVQGVLGDEERMGDAYLSSVAKRLEEMGITANTELRRGRAARELVAAAKTGDVIVLASHGRGGITRWLLGSVAEDVLRHASVPVLLIRASDTAEVSNAGVAGGESRESDTDAGGAPATTGS
jgi:nucleotide-binding universal stress UspA family protein